MALSAFAWVTLLELKEFLGLADDETDRDTWLEGEINRQTARIESFLDRKVRARLYRQDINDDFQGDCLYLENTPIVAVENLWRDADREFDDDALIPSTDYSVYRDRIQFASRYSVSGYGAWWQNSTSLLRTIRVEYVAGWGTLDIPFDRQRIDLTEESGGDVLTFYLNGGSLTPTESVDALNIELNTAGDNERVVSFDWRSRQFTITQDDGDLELLPSGTGFTESESALPLLGFSGSGFTESPAIGTAVTLDIPEDLKGVVLDLIATRFDNHAHGDNPRRGVKSRTIGSYSESFTGATATEATMAFSEQAMSVLTQYRDWAGSIL